MSSSNDSHRALDVAARIRVVRGRRVLVDTDLAALYGVPTHRLNEAVKRNAARFPDDFSFRLDASEMASLTSQSAISKKGRGGRRTLPLVFTEHGALMVASILNSPRAVQVSLYVVRAFVRMREALSTNADLINKLNAIETSLADLDRKTREQFEEVYLAIRALTPLPDRAARQIGFTAPNS